jgi:hypothetical protein
MLHLSSAGWYTFSAARLRIWRGKWIGLEWRRMWKSGNNWGGEEGET